MSSPERVGSVAGRAAPRTPAKPSEPASIGEVVELVKTYAKQETLGPLKGAGRWLAMGAIGAVCLGIGGILLLLGMLRLVQAEWERSARGNLSWLPYVIVLIVTGAVIALVISRIKRDTLTDELNDDEVN